MQSEPQFQKVTLPETPVFVSQRLRNKVFASSQDRSTRIAVWTLSVSYLNGPIGKMCLLVVVLDSCCGMKPIDERDAQQKGPYIGDFAHDIKEDFIGVPSRVVFVSVGRASISQQDIASVHTKMSQCQAQSKRCKLAFRLCGSFQKIHRLAIRAGCAP